MKAKKVLLVINICLTGLVLWLGFTIYQRWGSGQRLGDEVLLEGTRQEKETTSQKERAKGGQDYRIIVAKDIFGTSKEQKKVPEKPKPEEIQKSDLDVELKGTIVGENSPSYAIISEKSKRSDDILGLEEFIGDARIVEIQQDRVILSREGKQEVLLISYESRSKSGPTAPASNIAKRPPSIPQTKSRPILRKRPTRGAPLREKAEPPQ